MSVNPTDPVPYLYYLPIPSKLSQKIPVNPIAPFPFLRLQPELRLIVYEQLLLFPVGLHPLPSTPTTSRAIDLSIIFLNKLIHKEAIKVFYSNNKFTLYHHQIHLVLPCPITCSCGYQFHPNQNHSFLTISKIKSLEIQTLEISGVSEGPISSHEWHAYGSRIYCPHASEMISCEVPAEDLISHLNDIPTLQSLKITCLEVESFEKVARALRRTLEPGSTVKVPEIGIIETTTGDKQIDLQYEDLQKAWNAFKSTTLPNVDPSDDFRDVESTLR